MNWDDLRFFLSAYRTGSFRASGTELRVDATTVSRRVDRLETDLKSTLFQRTSDGLLPTESGHNVFERALEIERKVRQITADSGGSDADYRGQVTLSTVVTYTSHFLMTHLTRFRDRYPEIDVVVANSDAMVDLSRGEADLAIRFRSPGTGPGVPATSDAIIARQLGNVGISVYASRDYLERRGHPKDAYDVEGHDVILPSLEVTTNLPGLQWFATVEDTAQATVRVEDLDSMLAAAVAGFGLACAPTFIAAVHPELVRISPPDAVDLRETWILMPTELRGAARVRALRDFLIDLHATHAEVLMGKCG